MKLLLPLFLALTLCGCASTPVRPKPPLPPLPPGFKAGKQISKSPVAAARFSPASATPTVAPGTGILQAPELWTDPDFPQFGKIFLARAYQGPNTVLIVEWSHDPVGPWNLVAQFECWPAEQIFLVNTTGNFGRLFMRGRHAACTPTFQPASARRLGATRDFRLRSGTVKAAKVEGVAIAETFSVWKVLP
jgi:hypothetical protein